MTLSTPNTGMAVTIDIGEVRDIHPINKRDVGIRLGLAAQAIAYHQRIEYSGPLYKSVKVTGDRVHLSFTHAEGLTAKGGALKGFAISGADRKFRNAKAELRGNKVIVWNDAVKSPAAVRYGWDFAPGMQSVQCRWFARLTVSNGRLAGSDRAEIGSWPFADGQ